MLLDTEVMEAIARKAASLERNASQMVRYILRDAVKDMVGPSDLESPAKEGDE